MRVSVIALSLLVFFVVLSAGSYSYAAGKVGYISVQRIVSESKIGKKYRAEYDKLKDKKTVEVEKARARIEALESKIKKLRQKKDVDLKKLKTLAEELQQKNKDFQRLVADIREEISKRDNELVIEILKMADPVLKRIAKKKGYSIILRNVNNLAYLDPEVDVTDEVIKELNSTRR